jgi:uncharacterized membrane protein YhaH (DUF805 family)
MAFKPFRDMFVFSGRSRRTEVLAFAILGMFANVVTVELVDGGMVQKVIGAGWAFLWGFPWIALLVRRLHDQGRPALWAWLLAAAFVMLLATTPLLPQSAESNYHVTVFAWVFHPVGPLAIVHGIAVAIIGVALFAFCLAPGDPDTNRYGPDPRLGPQHEGLDPA